MEDFQEQEYEFLRRLEEERIDRRTMVKRGLAAGIGLTVMSLSPTALAARMEDVLTLPEETLLSIGNAARAATRRFSWQGIAPQYEQLYREVVYCGGRPGEDPS